MPKRRVETQEMDAVQAAVAAFPDGAAVEEIGRRFDPPLHPRTLQRRLAKLTQVGKIRKRGRTAGTRYYPLEIHERPATSGNGHPALPAEPALSLSLPASREGADIFRAVSQLLQERKRVSYQRDFLDRYRANDTYYLPAAVRDDLAALGRVTEKVEPAGTYARHVLDRLLIELSFNSSRLEGNRYSLLETKQLIEAGRSATGKAAEETQMILNHKAAIEFLVAASETAGIDRLTIQNLHAILSDNLLGDPAASGRLRQKAVEISGSVYIPLAVPQLIEELFLQIIGVAAQITDPFEQAFFLLVHLPYLQPFEDVNKRVSRLGANISLFRSNLKPLSFVDVPKADYVAALLGVYELNRIELMRDVFVWAYRRSAEHYAAVRDSLGSPDEFRLKYRAQIKAAVAYLIKNRIVSDAAQARIGMWASEHEVAETDRARFIAVIESEMLGLHEWNVARFPVTPSEYKAWLAAAG
jgi:Fic family protein